VQAKPEPAKAKKPQAKPEPKKTKDISPDKKQTKAPKPKKREPEKKAPPQPSPEEILAQALSAAKTKAAKEQETEQQQVDRALQQLRQQVDEQARESGGGESSGASGAMEVYASIVEALVKKNWRYPAIGQSEELTATVEIDIDPSGAITGQRLTWGSGRPEFDASVLKAVSQTKSLPPPPTKDISRITINFNLQELNP
jgi:TolA protein